MANTPSTRVTTPRARASYANVFEPRRSPNGDLKYSIMLLFPKDSTDFSEMKAAVVAAAQKKFPSLGIKTFKDLKESGLKSPFRDGDKEPKYKGKEDYKGMVFINASDKEAPGIIDENKHPITSASEFWSGCWCSVSVTFFGYSNSGNEGVGVGLNNIMRLGKDSRLDNRMAAEDEFEAAPEFAKGNNEDFDSDDDFEEEEEDDIPF